ncbi:hypothetical protein [Carnobacterium iners]|uniref:hypothetical protein n=1 Tax=Carnobacterium iners TaxID=1073423 RepID=UPI000A1CE9E8|nr:hypothetical protein [Carnobacterium iners]
MKLGEEFKVSYKLYQNLIYAFAQKDYNLSLDYLNEASKRLSSYIKTSLKYRHNNGPIGATDNALKVSKKLTSFFEASLNLKSRF